MYNTKIFLSIAALAGASLAETFRSPACTATLNSLVANAPTYAPALAPWLQAPLAGSGRVATVTVGALSDPEFYLEQLCSVAAELPPSLLPDFQTWGSRILSYGRDHISVYDALITSCISTGEAGAAVTSYINSILTNTDGICQPTAAPSGGGGGRGPISTTPAPTATGINSNPSDTATSVATAAAPRATGVLIGAAAMGGLVGVAVML
ncbi:hypothetical protein F5B18DRAFT_164389 [Nemania serpens]|nr:hypothetical protein F5B18DRAFT_164389 [Nemania serpens]